MNKEIDEQKMAQEIYLDNAATTKMNSSVVEAMQPYFCEKYGNPDSKHNKGNLVRKDIVEVEKSIISNLNIPDHYVFFTSGGTEANNWVLFGVEKGKKNHMITTRVEHSSILDTAMELQSKGVIVTFLDVDSEGLISLVELEQSITEDTFLVSIQHANNETGVVQNLSAIYEICKEKDVLLHTDAVQSLGKIDFPSYVDLISIAGHKIHGPKGIGALLVRKGIELNSLLFGGDLEIKRPGTQNVPSIIGFGKAIESLFFISSELRDELEHQLVSLGGVVNGSSHRVPTITNVSFPLEGEAITEELNEKGIFVSTGSACHSFSMEPSHVLKAMGFDMTRCHGAVRFSFSKFNTQEDVDRVVEVMKEILE